MTQPNFYLANIALRFMKKVKCEMWVINFFLSQRQKTVAFDECVSSEAKDRDAVRHLAGCDLCCDFAFLQIDSI